MQFYEDRTALKKYSVDTGKLLYYYHQISSNERVKE
jgi:hypothetical protein